MRELPVIAIVLLVAAVLLATGISALAAVAAAGVLALMAWYFGGPTRWSLALLALVVLIAFLVERC